MALGIETYAATRRWRREESEQLVALGFFVGERLELLDGVLAVRKPQGSSHAAMAAQIALVLAPAFGPGWHPRLHAPLALGADSEPEPDLAIVAGVPRDHLQRHPSTAALVVEIADSSLRLDRRVKSALYAQARLPEYWIANLVDGVLEVHRDPGSDPASGWTYHARRVLDRSEVVAPLLAPTAHISVGDLLP
jgi:Uma2 family endonuclease